MPAFSLGTLTASGVISRPFPTSRRAAPCLLFPVRQWQAKQTMEGATKDGPEALGRGARTPPKCSCSQANLAERLWRPQRSPAPPLQLWSRHIAWICCPGPPHHPYKPRSATMGSFQRWMHLPLDPIPVPMGNQNH